MRSGRAAALIVSTTIAASAWFWASPSSGVAGAAKNLLAALAPEQAAKARFNFTDDERKNWYFVPIERKGLAIREMTPTQRHLAYALMSAGLSPRGFLKATTIMSQEEILRVLENDSGERRNPEKYYFSVFGEPSESAAWGYRVEGHHVSLNYTVDHGEIQASPTFLGANPAEVRTGPRAGLRVLGAEEDLAHELLVSMTAAQKSEAVIAEKAYGDIVTGNSRQAIIQGAPAGVPLAKLNDRQRAMLRAVVEEYIGNMPEPVAAARRKLLERAGNNVRFAWAGVAERGGPHYYRVQTPEFLIEFDNTQNRNNHVHSVWREFRGDWGEDLLAKHYRESPHHHGNRAAHGSHK